MLITTSDSKKSLFILSTIKILTNTKINYNICCIVVYMKIKWRVIKSKYSVKFDL